MSFLKEYTMLKELGKGGFATVYKVRHNELGYIRAIRVLNDTITDERSETYSKFLEECKLLLRLGNGTHPNIVHIYQPRLLDNKALVEMDFVDGSDLTHYIAEKRFIPIEEVLRFVSEISNALAYCHEDIFRFCMDPDADDLQSDPNDGSKVLLNDKIRKLLIQKYKVIHNDIHSGNVIRKYDGSFVLLDFGLAIEGESIVRSSRRRGGAPEFKAPEKWDNERILSEQSDIYSFGIVLYEMLAGQVPFVFDKKLSNQLEAELMVKNAHQDTNTLPPDIEPLRRATYEKANPGKPYEKDYPDWLEQVIMKCLEKKPENRFANGKKLFLEVEKNLKETNRLNDEEFRKLKAANEDLISILKTVSEDNEKLKQGNEKLTCEINKLAHAINKLKKSKVIWKILTGIAAVLFIVMIFAYWGKPTSNIDNTVVIDTSGYEATIAEQKNQMEYLQSENDTLQMKLAESKGDNSALIEKKNKEIEDLKTENTKLKNQPPLTVTKEVIKDNPAQAEKIKILEQQVKTITEDRDKWKDRALGSK